MRASSAFGLNGVRGKNLIFPGGQPWRARWIVERNNERSVDAFHIWLWLLISQCVGSSSVSEEGLDLLSKRTIFVQMDFAKQILIATAAAAASGKRSLGWWEKKNWSVAVNLHFDNSNFNYITITIMECKCVCWHRSGARKIANRTLEGRYIKTILLMVCTRICTVNTLMVFT